MKELYYLAGLIDGEGTITLSKIHGSDKFRTPIISMSSTTPELVEYLKQNYGGHICKHKIYKDNHKQSWSWKLSYSPAVNLCNRISSLLREPSKRYRAKLISENYPCLTKRNGKYSEDEVQAKLAFEDIFFHPSIP